MNKWWQRAGKWLRGHDAQPEKVKTWGIMCTHSFSYVAAGNPGWLCVSARILELGLCTTKRRTQNAGLNHWIELNTCRHEAPNTESYVLLFCISKMSMYVCGIMYKQLTHPYPHVQLPLFISISMSALKASNVVRINKQRKKSKTERELLKIDISCWFLIKNVRRVKLISIWAPPNWQMNWYRKLNWGWCEAPRMFRCLGHGRWSVRPFTSVYWPQWKRHTEGFLWEFHGEILGLPLFPIYKKNEMEV